MFVSFGLDTPEDQIYAKQQTILGKKKKLILRWRDIEEVACRKLLNLDIGLEIQTTDKRIKSYNLLNLADKKRFFLQLEIIRKLQNDCFKVIPSLEQFKKSDVLNPWLKCEIQN